MIETPIGYIIMRSFSISINGTKVDSGFDIDYSKQRVYKRKESAENAIKDFKLLNPRDKYEIHPIYWKGRQ